MTLPRIACALIPDLALQLLHRDRPDWRGKPVAVVDDERPNGRVLFVSREAEPRVRIGMRYAAAQSLEPALRARAVSPEKIRAAIDSLAVELQTFSPRVEPDMEMPGVLWVDPGGMARLYGGPANWAKTVHRYLVGRGFRAVVVVGFGRYRCHAIACTRATGSLVMASVPKEIALASEVKLDRLALSEDARSALSRLEVRTLGDLLALPAGELGLRFGEEVARLRARAADEPKTPMQPLVPVDPVRAEVEIDPPDDDQARLLFAMKGALHAVLVELGRRSEALAALDIEFRLERGDKRIHRERIKPAAATRDAMLVLELVRLRLADVTLSDKVEKIEIVATGARTTVDQLVLLPSERPRRDKRAAARALARVRAAYGPTATVRARLRDAHLPEAKFTWEPITEIALPSKTLPPKDNARTLSLVRRMLSKPVRLPGGSPESTHPGPAVDQPYGALLQMTGPYKLSGGWWVRTVERDYYYAETRRGDLLVVFYDRARATWYLHGFVD